MVYFLNLDGTMTLAEPQRVFQGSNNVNTVYVLSAIAPPTALEISFTLPSGLTTAYYPMIYNGLTDEYTVPSTTTTVYLRSFLLTSNITAEVGTVGVSINAVYSNADGTTGNQTSFTGSFNVEYSSIPESVTTGTADELQQALDLLSQYYTQQQAIITGGTNGEYLQSQGNNQLPVWTSFDMDFVTANRAQSFSEEQQAQARENINAQETINLTPNLAVVSNTDGTLTTAEATTEEVNYLSGVTSNIQTQLDGKQATLTFDDTPTSGSDNPVTSDGINTFVGEKINGNCVLFSGAQSLTAEQQLQARQNIGAEGSSDIQYFVSVLPQTFTTEQQAQATANINACTTNGTYPNVTAGTAQNSNNNLVLNGDFSYQGDGTSFSQTGVTYNNFGFRGANVTFDESGVSLVANSSDICGIYSIIPDGYKQSGKTVTLSVNVGQTTDSLNIAVVVNSSADISVVTAVGTKTTSTSGIVTTTVTLPTLTQTGRELKVFAWIQSPTANTSSFSLEYIKLEEGSVSTAPNNLVTNATNALFADTATNDGDGNNIVNTYATQNGTYPNMTVGTATTANGVSNSNYVYLASDYMSSDGLTWAREWSDGLKECGGTLTTNGTSTPLTVALSNTTFSDTNYQIYVTPKNLNNTASPVVIKIINNSITTTSFEVVGCYATASQQDYNATLFNYYCRGY